MRIRFCWAIIVSLVVICAAVSVSYSEMSKYESAGRRDPFVPLVGAERPVNAGLENISSVEDIRLEGIAMGPNGNNIAILNGEMVKESDKIGSLEVKKITEREVIIIFTGTERILTLSEQGGDASGK